MKIYISGKITGDDNYYFKFLQAECAIVSREVEKGRERTYQTCRFLNPAHLPEGLSTADYMRINFAMIDVADVVYFLPDWTDSEGAKLERAYCEYIGKAIEDLKEEDLK